ncbi:MAG: hypothetical protein WCZ86_05630 [Desulfurivibrionaceae bacterium]|jgi:hypothetical protein
MIQIAKEFLLNFSPISYFKTVRRKKKDIKELERWIKTGKQNPPPHIIKQKNLLDYATKYNLNFFVETGTFNGDMIEAMKDHFDELYSIELCQPLFEKAEKRFKFQKNITLIQGDSGKKLKSIMKRIDRPALFWLDGHYSGGETALAEKETPIFEELICILESKDHQHVIVIDDARLFGTDLSYPTINELNTLVNSRRDNLEITVEYDSIKIAPKVE